MQSGNGVLTYFANGNTVPVITIREILIASLGLLAMPKNIDINIYDIVGRTKMLPPAGGQIEKKVGMREIYLLLKRCLKRIILLM